MNERRQGVEVRSLQLGELSMLDQEFRERVQRGEFLQHVRGRTGFTAGRLLPNGKL